MKVEVHLKLQNAVVRSYENRPKGCFVFVNLLRQFDDEVDLRVTLHSLIE